jgi:signal transduction histidine kinase
VAAAAVSLDRDELLHRTLSTVMDLMDVESASIHLLDAEGRLQPVIQLGRSRVFLGDVPYEIVRGFLNRALIEGAAVTYGDETREPAEVVDRIRAAGMNSAVVVPIRSQDQTFGVLALGSGQGRRFRLYDGSLLTGIANQIGVALENATLLRQREQRITTLSVVNETSRAISAELDLDELYHAIYEQCRRTLDIPNFVIAVSEDGGKTLLPALVYLDGQQRASHAGWPSEPALLLVVAERRAPLLTNDYHATCAELGIDRAAHVTSQVRRAWLGVPMTIGERLIGVISAATTASTYSEEDRDLLLAVANQAAVAIENARLYQQTRELGVIEERNRLAREIHDTIAQGLTGIVLQLEATSALIQAKPERAGQRLAKATELARSTLAEARRSVWNLRPAPLEELSLLEAIRAEARRLTEEGLEVRTHIDGESRELGPDIENGLYRITQEALQNIRRHADARTVEIMLDWESDELSLTIRDDGQGFDPATFEGHRADGGGFGLLGMRERARLLHGTLDVQSAPGAGTCLRVRVPLSARPGIPRPTQPATPDAPRALIP